MNIINALDQNADMTPFKKSGENGHAEYGWSQEIKEQITQFSYQLVRTTYTGSLERILRSILSKLQKQYTEGNRFETITHLSTMYKMIGYTRDIIDGKGEYQLTFMQILIWFDYFPELAKYAIEKLVKFSDDEIVKDYDKETHPYGSWRDIKYLCKYVQSMTNDNKHPLILHAIKLMNDTIDNDYMLYRKGKKISLASKWCPREKSAFSSLYKDLVYHNYKNIFDTAKTKDGKYRAYKKASMKFRQTLSTLNKYIDTVQIKMCGENWRNIDFNKVPSVAMSKNRLAFLNTKNPKSCEDRIICAENLRKHITDVIENSKKPDDDVTKKNIKINGKRVSVYDLVRHAINLDVHDKDNPQYNMCNIQWDNNASQNGDLPNIIPMADVSGSMNADDCRPLYSSIGLSIRVSEKTTPEFRNRVLTFTHTPTWVNLTECNDFVEKVHKLKTADWGMTTDFYKALKKILDVIVENNMRPESVEDLIVVVFSDMQINEAYPHYFHSSNGVTMFDKMKDMYTEAGMKTVYNKPYKPPHIVFWNLRGTGGFPSLSSQKNTTMIGGYSPVLINAFCNKGIEALKEYDPYNMLQDILSNKRYKPLETKLLNEL